MSRVIFLAVAVSLLGLEASGQSILMIGDGITEGGYPLGEGNGIGTGYRDPLTRMLAGQTIGGVNPDGIVYNAHTVGSKESFWMTDASLSPGYLLNDPRYTRHESHLGLLTNDFATALPGLMGGVSTDIALIDLGAYDAITNWINIVYNGQVGLTDFENGLHSVLSHLQPVDGPARARHVFVATLLPLNPEEPLPSETWREDVRDQAPVIDMINESIAAVVGAHAGVTLVDMHTGFDIDWVSYDNIHPNAEGATFMAEQWFNAMEAEGVLSAIPEPSAYATMLAGASLLVAFGRGLRRRRECSSAGIPRGGADA